MFILVYQNQELHVFLCIELNAKKIDSTSASVIVRVRHAVIFLEFVMCGWVK